MNVSVSSAEYEAAVSKFENSRSPAYLNFIALMEVFLPSEGLSDHRVEDRGFGASLTHSEFRNCVLVREWL
jgi:hypothetical protein